MACAKAAFRRSFGPRVASSGFYSLVPQSPDGPGWHPEGADQPHISHSEFRGTAPLLTKAEVQPLHSGERRQCLPVMPSGKRCSLEFASRNTTSPYVASRALLNDMWNGVGHWIA
jgi:hypothetical protein